MINLSIALWFAATFTVVFGLCVVVARKRAAAREAERERLAVEERKRQVMQAKADDIWRLNKRLPMR